jgi:hypothetical protein
MQRLTLKCDASAVPSAAMAPSAEEAGCDSPASSRLSRLNLLDRVEHFQNRAANTVTEMNFGLRSAGNGRLARHGRPGRRSTYLRTAIILNLHQEETHANML